MSRFFVGRPIVAMVIAILMVIVGAVALVGLPVAQYPNIVPPQIQVRTIYTGADAVTVEQSVATPIEQQMSGVEKLLYMQSTNANDGSLVLQVTFDIDSNIAIDQVNTQNKVAQAQPSLPADVASYGLTFQQSTGLPLLGISLYSPKGSFDTLFIGNYATINLTDALYRVPGVGQVLNWGTSDYAMRVWVKPDKLAKLGLTVPDLAAAIQAQNNVNPSGRLGAEPAPRGQQFTYTVRAQGRLLTAEEFGNIAVRLNPDGSTVRLSEVARIELGALTYNQLGRYNGKPALVFGVFQTPGSNAIAVANGVRATMAELKKRFPADLDYAISLDTTAPVTEGIREILVTLLETVLLVALVVFLFLQSWRATLIPLLAVPVSLIGTFVLFPFLGFSINTLSLFGLVLAIGLVVDDAIVVVEAVERHIEEGLTPKDATLAAMKEVTAPVVSVAVILAAVFIPLAFTGGITGLLNRQFALTIAVSVLFSAFNALTLSPALSALLLRPRQERKGVLAGFFGGFNRWFGRANDGYVKASAFLARKAVVGIAILAGFTVLTVLAGKKVPAGFIPEEDQGYFFLNVTLPDAASLERTDAVCRKIDAILAATPEVQSYNTIAGFSILSYSSATYSGFYFVSLKNWSERPGAKHTVDAVIARINGQLAGQVNEAIAFGFPPPAIPGLGASGGFSMWIQDRSGADVPFLAKNLNAFIAAARKRPEVGSINTVWRASVPQIYADVDRDKVLKQGISLSSVYQTMQAFMGGGYINQFNRFGRQWRVYLQAEGDQRQSTNDIAGYYVRNANGQMVPLSAFVSTKRVYGPEFTNRFNLFRGAHLIGGPAPGYSSDQVQRALEQVANQVLPREMGFEWADLSFQQQKAAGTGTQTFVLSLMFVFLILAALYESWSLPFSVLLSLPIAVFGAFAGLLLRKYDLNVYSQIGLVMLVGLSAKNAILIVEFAKGELEKGRPLMDAALEGARLRFRPVLMTSFAFIFGLLPLWIASGAGAVSRRILGTAVITGMLAATAIAIFVIPMLFVLVERLSHRRKTQVEGRPLYPVASDGGHVDAVSDGGAQVGLK
ncbi:MAG: multidrug efflux RND transporter permease subunit [Deltaproteobacteria bacterium]|nr:MAG: multidrug efflux RND transporter permease subunit [Deltaproteobacteria bacterium]